MKRMIIVSMVLTALMGSTAYAKRIAPAKATPVKSGQIEYRAPRDQMGCVEAWDTTKNKMLWRRQIYVVKYDLDLEKDIQDVFIKSMKLNGNTLLIANERKSEFVLDLKTLDVKVTKGKLLESR